MNCKKAARLLLLSFDDRLSEKDRLLLEDHIATCWACREKEKEYREILNLLQLRHVPEPLPYFERRLMAKLAQAQRDIPAFFWQKWIPRAAAVFLMAGLFFGVGVLFFQPREIPELSQTEILLLRNENPLTEAATILDQKKPEERSMMLIFAAAEMRVPPR